jgi:hypothetical protein
MKLPGGEIGYANQYIVEGIPLTWGEATKDCTRIPTSSLPRQFCWVKCSDINPAFFYVHPWF